MSSDDAPATSPPLTENEHAPPKFKAAAYHCPFCGVLAAQNWYQLYYNGGQMVGTPAFRTHCTNCREIGFWLNVDGERRMVEPRSGDGPRPHAQMPADVRADYEEARSVLTASPRSACALLRLATEKLVQKLEPGAGSLNERIGRLVEKGVPEVVQQALDALRVVGNDAVHPGEMALEDDVETASALFECINAIVEDRISRPNRIQSLYNKLPHKKREGIDKRDSR